MNEPTDPIDNAEPIDPIDRTEPFEPIDKTESSDQSDQRDPESLPGLMRRASWIQSIVVMYAPTRVAVCWSTPLATIGVVLLKVRKGRCRRDRVHVIIAMVVEGHVYKRVVRQPEDDVADVVRLGGGQFLENTLDSSLVLVRRLRGPCRVARHQALLH
jgi:hypothetical protein